MKAFGVVFFLAAGLVLAQAMPTGLARGRGGQAVSTSSSSSSTGTLFWLDGGAGFIFADESLSNPDAGPVLITGRATVTAGVVSDASLVLKSTLGTGGNEVSPLFSFKGNLNTVLGSVMASQAEAGAIKQGLNLYGGGAVLGAQAVSFWGSGPVGGVGTLYGFFNSNGLSMNTRLTFSTTVPVIGSGFGTSPSVTAGISTAFRVNVGTGGVATSGVINLPTASTGWNCVCTDLTTQSATVHLCKQTASTTTTATIGNFTTAGVAGAWVASDILAVNCTGY